MNNQEPHAEEFGYLKLFNPEGVEVPASWQDLLLIEGMSFDVSLHRRVVGDRSGRYWLVSNRPGYHAMLLEVGVFHCYPREEDNWSVSYGTNGVASYPGWKLEPTLKHFRKQGIDSDPWDGMPIPENVVQIAREQVTYRLGKTPGPDPLDMYGVRMHDAADMRTILNELFEGADLTELLEHAGERVALIELMLAVILFCANNDIDITNQQMIRRAIVPKEEHQRLDELIAAFAIQSVDPR